VAGMPGLRAVIAGSSAVVLFAGLFNVGELLLAEELGGGDSGFALLVAIFGLGVVAGSLAGAHTTEPRVMKRRYLAGLAVTGVGFLAAAAAPAIALAAVGFAVAGLGNGLVMVHERLLMQVTVDDQMLGRVFGLRDGLDAWAWAIAFAGAGLLLATLDTRIVLALAGAGVCTVAAVSTWALRNAWQEPLEVEAVVPLPELVETLEGLEAPVPAGARS
jgi:MFS family permease